MTTSIRPNFSSLPNVLYSHIGKFLNADDLDQSLIISKRFFEHTAKQVKNNKITRNEMLKMMRQQNALGLRILAKVEPITYNLINKKQSTFFLNADLKILTTLSDKANDAITDRVKEMSKEVPNFHPDPHRLPLDQYLDLLCFIRSNPTLNIRLAAQSFNKCDFETVFPIFKDICDWERIKTKQEWKDIFTNLLYHIVSLFSSYNAHKILIPIVIEEFLKSSLSSKEKQEVMTDFYKTIINYNDVFKGIKPFASLLKHYHTNDVLDLVITKYCKSDNGALLIFIKNCTLTKEEILRKINTLQKASSLSEIRCEELRSYLTK